MNKTVLVLGDYKQSIAVVRSLGQAGHRVVVGQYGNRSCAGLSRYADGRWEQPVPVGDSAFIPALRRLLARRPDIAHVFPVGEADVAALLEGRDDIDGNVRFAMPAPAVVRTCLAKADCYRLAGELGVPLVPFDVASDMADLRQHAATLGLPLVAKCPDSTRLVHDRKAVICRTGADLAALADVRFPLVVQQWFDGIRHNCQFAARDGEIAAYFQQAVVRTDEADGTGFGVEGVSVTPSQDLYAHCASLTRHLRYTGVGCAQFLVNETTGRQAFLEINPRLDATCELALRCGVDLPRLAIGDGVRVPRSYPVGRRFHWLLGDLRGVRHRRRQPGAGVGSLLSDLRRLTVSFCRANCRLTWDWSDPMPTLYLYGRALLNGGRSRWFATNQPAGSH